MTLALPPPIMLSARIPFQGTYGSIWEYAVDSETGQTLAYLDEDPDAFARTFPDLPPRFASRVAQMGEELFEVTDYSAIWRNLAAEYAAEFEAWLADSLGLPELPFEFEEMTSPKFYNFETDRLFAKLSLATFEAVRDRLAAEAPDQLAATYRELFTSYDGFASFYDSGVPAKPLAEWDHNELYALLTAWVEHTLDGRSLDDELYDYRPGGLYEGVYRIVDAAIDWPKFEQLARDAIFSDLSDAERQALADFTPRCPLTMELPL